MIYFLVPAAGDFGMRDYLALWGKNLAHRIDIVHYENLPAMTRFGRGTYIMAGLDQLEPGMLQLVQQLSDRLRQAGCRLLNHATATLRRYELLCELRRLQLNDFAVARAVADPGTLRYPVFLRSEREHDGALSPLLGSQTELDKEIGLALLRGHTLKDLLVAEFCDTSDQHGIFRKYAVFIVGDQMIPRHLAQGNAWMVKHGTANYTLDMAREERDFVRGNPHATQLMNIFRTAGVEYGRIDYAVKNGRVQTWEINLNPTIGRGLRAPSGRIPPELEPIRGQTKDHFYRGFEAALAAIVPESAGPPIDFSFSAATIAAAASRNGERGHLFEVLRKTLRPTRMLIEPLLPLVVRVARRTAASRTNR